MTVLLEYAPQIAPLAPYLTKKTLSFKTASMPRTDATIADLWNPTPTVVEMGRTLYELDMDKEHLDAFYQLRSHWMFILANQGEEDNDRFVEDCFTYVAGCGGSDYQLSGTAHNDD